MAGCDGADRILDAIAARLKDRLQEGRTPDVPLPIGPPVEGKPPEQQPTQPPTRPTPAPATDIVDPMRASVRIVCGTRGCSGTLFRMDSSDTYWLLTCAHCIPRSQPPVEIHGDGWRMTGNVTKLDRKFDIALVRCNQRGRDKPIAELASVPPAVGQTVWHHGFGVDKPGNVERGAILQVGDAQRACWYTTRLSNGDSGSGQFDDATGKLVALGAWSDPAGRYGGASLMQIKHFLGSSPPSTPPGYGPG